MERNRLTDKTKHRIASFVVPVLSLFLSAVLFRTVLFFGYVPTVSMEPTLKAGSFCFGVRIDTKYEVGDIVAFNHDGQVLVKRIAATGGTQYAVDDKTFNVPEGSFFMRGDNSDDSIDSRYWENPYVSEKDIVATILFKK